MKHFIAIILGLAAIINLSACKKDRLTANGNIVSEIREVPQFTGINSSGATPVKVNYGTNFKVKVKGSSNLVPQFTTRVADGVLHLSFGNVNVHRDDIEVELTMPTINSILVSGSGEVDIRGDFPALPNLTVSLSGSAEVEAQNSMQIENVKVEISGSGEVDLEDVLVSNAEANISGSGEVKFRVQNKLKAKISGSGKVYYQGHPLIQQEISGSGKLVQF